MDIDKNRESLLAIRPLYARLKKELTEKIHTEGYPKGPEYDLLRNALQRVIAERSVPTACSTLDQILLFLGYGLDDAFCSEYRHHAEQLGERQLRAASLTKEAMQTYFDLHECQQRLGKDDCLQTFSKAFGMNSDLVYGVLQINKKQLCMLEDTELANAVLESLCDEPALEQAIASARAEKHAQKQALSDQVKAIMKTLPPMAVGSLAKELNVSASTLQMVVYNPTSERVSLDSCELALQRIKQLKSDGSIKQANEPKPKPDNVAHQPSAVPAESSSPSSMAEDVAHSAMSMIQSALRMLETAGKTYVFPHELQVKGVNLSRSLKRIALQGAREENVMEGRPLSQNALESLSGKT